jgi:hypothetical protein
MIEVCISRFAMARYDTLLQQAEALWQKETARKVPIQEVTQ